MQTREMKREYEVAVLDPAGNVTAIVLSDVQAAERARIAAQLLRLPELRIEQAAFLTAPRCGGEIRLEMMGGEFCGNALRCAGFYHALRTGAQGKTCVLAEISGAEGVQPVMADTAAGEASTVMPLPRAVQPADWPDVQAVRVTFDGITHFVMDRAQPDDALVQRAIAAAPEASAVGALFLDRAAGSMQPVVFVRETGSCVAETSCASGSVGRRAHGGLWRRHYGDRHRPAGRHARGRRAARPRRGDGAVHRRPGASGADADRCPGGRAVLIRKLCLHIRAQSCSILLDVAQETVHKVSRTAVYGEENV